MLSTRVATRKGTVAIRMMPEPLIGLMRAGATPAAAADEWSQGFTVGMVQRLW
jgi:hypothetical protein